MNPQNPMDRWIERHLARLEFGRFLRHTAEWLAAFLFVFGAVVLGVKLALPNFWPGVLWLGLLAIPVCVAAWLRSRNARFSRTDSAAMLDQALGAGGLLMTLAECRDARWEERLPQAEAAWREGIPRVRPSRFARFLVLPLMFAVGAGFIPLRKANTEPILRNTVGRKASRDLEEMLDQLEDVAVLEEKERKQLEEEISKLTEETKKNPLTHEKWEIVDSLRERMRVRLDSAALEAAKARDATGLLSKDLAGDGPPLSDERKIELEKDVIETLRKMMKNGAFKGASQNLRDELQRLTKNGQLKLPDDSAERQKLLDELKEHLDQEWEKLEEARKKCQGGQQGDCPLCGKGDCKGGQCQGHGHGNRPGRGGVNRGRGDANLNLDGDSDAENTEFKNTVLPPGFLDDPKNQVLGVRRVTPTVDPAESAVRGAKRKYDPASGRETWNRRLRPRHRSVVKKYFETK
jgi:hypothetical protein